MAKFPPAQVLLADADAFFVAVARLVDPEGAGRAPLLIVGGSRDSRGVVCSASYEARRFGVRSAMSIAQALRLCPGALCVPVPRKACGAKSAEIRRVLLRYAPVVEGASVDEWYLDLSGTEGVYHHEPLAATAQRIREAVQAATGLTLSIGGGTNKLVAKLAVDRAKPRENPGGAGVCIVEAGTEAAFLRTCTLGEIPGNKDLNADRDIERELFGLVSRAASDLRAEGLTARTVTVRLRDWDFRTRTAQRTLPDPVAADRAIMRVARDLLAEMRALRRVPARLVGVRLSSLAPVGSADQLTLFGASDRSGETSRDRDLTRAVDGVRRKFREASILPARLTGPG